MFPLPHADGARAGADSRPRPSDLRQRARRPGTPEPLAVEGVSCTVCHQITADRLGQRASFNGGFTVDTKTSMGRAGMFGPYEVDKGRR